MVISLRLALFHLAFFLMIAPNLAVEKLSSFSEIKALLAEKNTYFIPLKIHGFGSGNIPYLDVKIENEIVTCKMDLGFAGAVNLPASIIREIQSKSYMTKSPSYGLSGKTYMSDIYLVDEVSIQNMTFVRVPIEESNEEFTCDIHLKGNEDKESRDQGIIGWRLFQRFNLLIDYKHSEVILCDSLDTLGKNGYSVQSFAMAPLLLDREFIEFEAKTEMGTLRCLLDSGCTLNMLNKDLENSFDHRLLTPQNTDQYSLLNPENENLLLTFNLEKICKMPVFEIGGKEFGPMTFNQIRSPMAIEAIVGMEFLEDTLIFIDFAQRKIYFAEYPLENASYGT